MTLEEVERLVRELEPRGRLKLAAGTCGELSGSAPAKGDAATRRERDEALRREFEEAMRDPLFVADMEEVERDFRYVDAETARMLPD